MFSTQLGTNCYDRPTTDAVVVLAAIHPRVDLYGEIKGCARVYGGWMYYGGTFYLPTHLLQLLLYYMPQDMRDALLDLCQGLLTQVLIA